MNILFLAPQPFFVARGTPIAVRLLLEHFSRRGWSVDALVFPGGQPLAIPGVTFIQVPRRPAARPIRPGFSLRKLGYDLHLFLAAWRRIRRKRYDYIHSVEEAAFLAWFLHAWKRIPFVCDMDSSIPDQLAEGHALFRWIRPLLRRAEAAMLRRAEAVLAVCDSLAERARRCTRAPVLVLRDPPTSAPPADAPAAAPKEKTAFVYVGNLQGYQGIPLLLKSFQRAIAHAVQASLIVVGGEALDIETLQRKGVQLGIADRVTFAGACALEETGRYLHSADVLVSPRLRGANTPMKLYDYLQAGKAILATDIPAHTQVLTPDTARLVPPEPEALAEAIEQLADDPALREKLGRAARCLSDSRYSRVAYVRAADEFCERMEAAAHRISGDQAPG